MPIPDKIDPKPAENTVYFYPGQLKVSYSQVKIFKNYLQDLFNTDKNLDEKLKYCDKYFQLIFKELYKKGILDDDHTLVVTDPIANKDDFTEALETAYAELQKEKFLSLKNTEIKKYKRQFITAIFIKKDSAFQDFFKIMTSRSIVYSKILSAKIDLEKHGQIKFSTTKELEEYIVNILTRTALLSQGCSIYVLKKYLSIIIELVIWYSRSIALIERRNTVSVDTLSSAISIVDSYYITDPEFIKVLQGRKLKIIARLIC